MGSRRASARRMLRQTGLTRTVMHFDTHMRDGGHLGDKLLVMVRGLRVVRHYRYNRRQVLRPNPPDVEIGDPVIRIGFDGRPDRGNGCRIDIAVQQDRAGVAQQPV